MNSHAGIDVQTFIGPGFAQNAYIVSRRGADTAVAIDPGSDARSMAAALDAAGARLEAILLTHAHLDHIEGIARLEAAHSAPVYLHPGDRPLYATHPGILRDTCCSTSRRLESCSPAMSFFRVRSGAPTCRAEI